MKIDDIKMESESAYYIPTLTAAKDMLFIALLFCVTLIITNPIGDFPLADDWSMGLPVKHLLDTGDYRPTGWTAMPLISNVLWGTLFSIPAGFSFNALRLSTLTMALLGIFGTYLLIRELRQPRWLAIVASLTLAFNPIYYALSHTFLTDVPFTALMIFASLMFVRNLKTGSNVAYLLGAILSVAATLSRQLAISVPLAFAVILIIKNGITMRNIFRAAIPAIFSIGALLIFQQWLAVTGRLFGNYHLKNDALLQALRSLSTITAFMQNSYVALLYLGLFLLPVLIFVFGFQKKKALPIFLTSALLFCALALPTVKNHLLMPLICFMPYGGNTITESGIGYPTLRDAWILNLNNFTALPTSFWQVATVLSLLGAALLITAIGLKTINLAPKLWPAKMNANEASCMFLLLSAMIYLFPILVNGMFDRYLVPAIPFLAAGITGGSMLISSNAKKACRFPAVALLLAFSLFTICGTRDYLAWNRLRWEALHDLMENKNVKPDDIDGGFEFNGWYLYDPHHDCFPQNSDPQKSFWWVRGDTYRIGFGNMPGYTVIKEYRYFHWMPSYAAKIVVLKKNLL